MKWALLVVLALAVLFCAGCLSKEDQLALNNLTVEQKEKIDALIAERLQAYDLLKSQTEEVKAKVESGAISLKEGTDYIALLHTELQATVDKVNAQIQDTKQSYANERDRLMAKGESKAEYYGGILISMIGAFLGTNAYRSKYHSLTKEIT